MAKVPNPTTCLLYNNKCVTPNFSFWNWIASSCMNSSSPIGSSSSQANVDKSSVSSRILVDSFSGVMSFSVDIEKQIGGEDLLSLLFDSLYLSRNSFSFLDDLDSLFAGRLLYFASWIPLRNYLSGWAEVLASMVCPPIGQHSALT